MYHTQIEAARKGIITSAMQQVAEREKYPADFICTEVAAGRIVIPANPRHDNLNFIGIGRKLSTKINANIGNSALTGTPENELRKLHSAIAYGADTVMDLSTGGDISLIRQKILKHSSVPVGTVPIYEITARFGRQGINEKNLLKIIQEQAEQGVDYMTIHAGFLQKLLPCALQRKLKIVSRRIDQ